MTALENKLAEAITLRDYFAGQAIMGMILSEISDEKIAEWAYAIADAMLKERAKEESK